MRTRKLNDRSDEIYRSGKIGTSARFFSRSPEETRLLGELVSRFVRQGAFLLLYGPLGSGKTEFVRGFARRSGWENVRSPSFTIVNEYPTTPRIVHADLYRIDEAFSSEFSLEEYACEGSIVIVEWADHWTFPSLPDVWEARFYPCEGTFEMGTMDDRYRVIEISWQGEKAVENMNIFLPEFDDFRKKLGK